MLSYKKYVLSAFCLLYAIVGVKGNKYHYCLSLKQQKKFSGYQGERDNNKYFKW